MRLCLFLLTFTLPLVVLTAQSDSKDAVFAPAATTTQIHLRCGSTLATEDPLLVVDGVLWSYDKLEHIRPENIESISVIKDASGTAIYGNRGVNGVLIITTKSGNYAEPDYVFNSQFLMPGEWQNYPEISPAAGAKARYLINGKRVKREEFVAVSAYDIASVRVYNGREKAKAVGAGKADVVFELWLR